MTGCSDRHWSCDVDDTSSFAGGQVICPSRGGIYILSGLEANGSMTKTFQKVFKYAAYIIAHKYNKILYYLKADNLQATVMEVLPQTLVVPEKRV